MKHDLNDIEFTLNLPILWNNIKKLWPIHFIIFEPHYAQIDHDYKSNSIKKTFYDSITNLLPVLFKYDIKWKNLNHLFMLSQDNFEQINNLIWQPDKQEIWIIKNKILEGKSVTNLLCLWKKDGVFKYKIFH